MPTPLKKAARYQAHAVTCLTNAEAAPDEEQLPPRQLPLIFAEHF